MKTLLFGLVALLGAWLVQPALQVDHEPVGTTTTTARDDQSPPPTTREGGRTMR